MSKKIHCNECDEDIENECELCGDEMDEDAMVCNDGDNHFCDEDCLNAYKESIKNE